MIKVRAVVAGVYKDRQVAPGDIFEVEDQLFADAKHSDPHLAKFGWMERIAETPSDRRVEARDEGEVEQREAEKKGWA